VADGLEASWAKAEVVELIDLQPQTLFLLDTFQIFRDIPEADVSQVLIIVDLVEDGAPDRHFP
jgi:hypothetical protein